MGTRLIICMLALVAAACAQLPEREPLSVSQLTLEENEWRVADNVIVVTDASFSMYRGGSFPEAKALTRSFIASMPDPSARARRPGQYAAGSIAFGGSERTIVPLSDFDRQTLAQTSAELDLLGSSLPNTPLDRVLDEAREALDGRSGSAAIVIFSDGRPNSPEAALAAAQELAASVPDGACIHTVQTGDDPQGAELLASLANVTECGTSRNASTVGAPHELTAFTRRVMVAEASRALPQVAAIDPCATVLRLQALQFAFNSAEITPEGADVLDVAVEHFGSCTDVSVRIEGHTDSIGPEQYNEGLSVRRAAAVQRYFVDAGIAPERLAIEGFGERNPLASNDTPGGRAENRRVDVQPQM